MASSRRLTLVASIYYIRANPRRFLAQGESVCQTPGSNLANNSECWIPRGINDRIDPSMATRSRRSFLDPRNVLASLERPRSGTLAGFPGCDGCCGDVCQLSPRLGIPHPAHLDRLPTDGQAWKREAASALARKLATGPAWARLRLPGIPLLHLLLADYL